MSRRDVFVAVALGAVWFLAFSIPIGLFIQEVSK